MRMIRIGVVSRLSILVFACLALILVACDESDDIIVNTVADNQQPLVVRQGPEFPSGTVDAFGSQGAPQPWVLVGDPNGLDDISAVLFSTESIRIHGIILRPDAMTGFCASPLFEPDNVIDTTSLIPVPVDIPGLTDVAMAHDEGGIYRIAPFVPPELAEHFDSFGRPSGCGTGGGFVQWVMLLPPAMPSPTSVFVTYLDVEFIGNTVTVYDKVGAAASTTFPNLRVVWEPAEEQAVSP